MKFASLALVMLCCLFSKAEESSVGWLSGQSTEARQLTELNSKLTRAYLEEDIPVLRGLLDDHHVHNNVFGSVMDKETFLRDIESGILVFEQYDTPELHWQIDGKLAVATGLIEARAIRSGRQVPARKFRFTRVFVKRDSGWKVLLFHNTMADQKPPGAAE